MTGKEVLLQEKGLYWKIVAEKEEGFGLGNKSWDDVVLFPLKSLADRYKKILRQKEIWMIRESSITVTFKALEIDKCNQGWSA